MVAGCIAVLASIIHGVVGDRIVRRIDTDAIGGRVKFLLRATWHFTTITFGILGIALLWAGVKPGSTAATGVAYTAGALFSCWSVLALISGFMRGGARGWVAHPAPLMLSAATALIWWGATWL